MSNVLEPTAAAAVQATFGFQLSDDQLAIRKMVREFAETEIAPHVMEWDEAQIFPRGTFQKLGELGLLGVLVPESLGGAGLTYVDYVGVVEELSRVDGSIGLSVAAHNSLCTNHILMFGTDEQKRRWVTPLATGQMIGAWGLTEAEAGSDAKGTKTTAVLDGEQWVLNGSKNFITHASVGDVAVLMAVTDKTHGTHGISAFIVDLHQKGIVAGSPAVTEAAWHPRPRGLHLPDLGGKVRRIDENPGGAVPEDVCELRHGQAKIDGHHDSPRLGACEEYLQKLRCVGHENGNPFTLADPPGREGVGHPVHPLVELAVREGARFLLLQERPLRIDRRPLENPFAYIHLVTSIKIRQTFPEPLFAAIAPACLMGIANDAPHFEIRA